MWSSRVVLAALLFLYLFSFVTNVVGSEDEDDEDDIKVEGKKEGKAKKQVKKKDTDGSSPDFGKSAHLRPTKCQTCRVLAQELLVEINATSDIKKSYSLTHGLDGETAHVKKKTIEYKYSEIRLMDILESVCKNVYNYRTVAGPDFPYLKGVKSLFRQSLEDSVKQHGLTLNLDAPEELVEDPTSELRRMFYSCSQMVEIHEDDIMDWYMNKQDDNPIGYLCADRIVPAKEQDCLYASTDVPEGTTPPKKLEPGEKTKFSYTPRHKDDL